MEDKLLYFHFYIGDKAVRLQVAGPDGAVLEEASAPLNFEDNLFSALNVLHRLMRNGRSRSDYQPDREFIRKIGRIQASLLNIAAADGAAPVAVQVLFEKHWKTLNATAGARATFTLDFAQQAPYTELAELPWEYLSYQNLDLSVNPALPSDFIRKVPVAAAPNAPNPLKKSEALRILLIISEPDPDALRRAEQPLVVYRESYVYRLLRVYENLANAQLEDMDLRVLFQPRPAELQTPQLQRKAVPFDEFLAWFQKNMVEPDSDPIRSRDNQDFQPQVVHFMGHVSTDEREEEVVGCINDENGLAYTPYQSFAASFALAPPMLLLLQSPEGVQLHKGPFSHSGLLFELAQKRLPYILSFQNPLREQGSLAFLRELYNRLFQAETVPAAVSAARQLLNRDLGHFADVKAFGSPALYSTLAGRLHYPLLAGQQVEAGPGVAAHIPVEQLTLSEKIDWYGREVRRLFEASELEMALGKFREIILIIMRSPDADVAAAESYQNEMSLMFQRFNDTKKAFEKGDIDNRERSRLYRSIGNTLLEYFKANALPGVARKTVDPERSSITTRQARPRTEDKIDAPR